MRTSVSNLGKSDEVISSSQLTFCVDQSHTDNYVIVYIIWTVNSNQTHVVGGNNIGMAVGNTQEVWENNMFNQIEHPLEANNMDEPTRHDIFA